MKKLVLVFALASIVAACEPAEDPKITAAVDKCAADINAIGPMGVAMANNDPEGYCRAKVKPIVDAFRLLEEQRKFDEEKARKAAP